MRRRRAQSGMTLVEVLWAMVATAIILGGLASALQGTMKVHSVTTDSQRLQQSARVILDCLQMDIRNASDATCPGASQLTLKNEYSDGSESYTTYFVQNGGLVRERDGESVQLIPENGTFQIQPFEVQLLREFVPIQPAYEGGPTTKEVTIVVRLDVEFRIKDEVMAFHSSTALRQNY